MNLHLLLNIICSTLLKNVSLLSIAIKQRAKFEGWLKMELAYQLAQNNQQTTVEHKIGNNSIDLLSNNCLIELKTPNTNYIVSGVINKTKPITDNINSILDDIHKLQSIKVNAGYSHYYVAFVLFPLDNGNKYQYHIGKIIQKTTNHLKKVISINGVNCLVFVCEV